MLLLVVFLSLASVYASLIPPFEGADSGGHFRYIAYLRQYQRLPPLSLETASFSHELVLQPPLYYLLSAILTPADAIDPALKLELVNPYYPLGLSKRATVSEPGAPADTLGLWIARYVSILGGMLAVLGTWLLVRELTASPWLALAAASLVGLNPQFLSIAANITNDAWPAATAAMTLWLAARSVHRDIRSRATWLGIGAVAGLSTLTKYSNLLVVLPLCFIVLPFVWKLRWKQGIGLGLCLALGALLTAGFWYLRNLALYGSPMPLGSMLALLPAIARIPPASASEIWRQMPVVLRSYWGIYGYGILAQPWFYPLIERMTLAGAAGLILFTLWRWRAGHAGSLSAVLLSLLWLAGSFVSIVSYLRVVLYSDQGRLLFPASPAIALLLVIGWSALLPKALWSWLGRLLPVALTALAITQIPILLDGYRIPPAIPQPVQVARPINAEFAGGMTLVGVDLPLGAGVDSQGGFPITLYLQARQAITGFNTLFLHLADSQDHMLWQFDGVPAGGKHPTRQWLPGQVFLDTYVVRVGDIPEDELATLSIGFYDYRDPTQPLRVLNGGPNADRVTLPVRLHAHGPGQAAPFAQPLATWANGILLTGAKVDSGAAGFPMRVSLQWQSRAAVMVDYTASVQVLNDQGKVLAQADQQPQSGTYPTSTWRAGDQIQDEFILTAEVSGWRRVILVLYDVSGKRLQLLAEGAQTTDYVELASR
jgi:4-amino-4-deoxy-L-arabinose transferase-like glycosyltransferase